MKKLTIFFMAAALYCSCSKDDYVKVTFDKKTFFEQKQLWQASNTKDYEYQFHANGFYGYWGTVTVENGNFKNYQSVLEFFPSSIPLHHSTIDNIYSTIEEMFNTSNGAKKSDFYYTEISVQYDKTNHIPIKFVYEFYQSPNLAVDGNFHFEITDFKKLN